MSEVTGCEAKVVSSMGKACVAMGEMHSPERSPKEGNGKPLLSSHYLENLGKDCHKLESTLGYKIMN